MDELIGFDPFVLVPMFLFGVFIYDALTRGLRSDNPWHRHLVWGLVAMTGTWAVLALLESITPAASQNVVQSPQGVSGPGVSDRIDGIIAMAIGVIGLVITGMTGMALASAWRAVDISQKAHGEIRALETEFRTRSLRSLAYVEALDLRETRRGARFNPADILCRAFATDSEDEARAILFHMASHPTTLDRFREMNIPEAIREYVNQLATDGSVPANERWVLMQLTI